MRELAETVIGVIRTEEFRLAEMDSSNKSSIDIIAKAIDQSALIHKSLRDICEENGIKWDPNYESPEYRMATGIPLKDQFE